MKSFSLQPQLQVNRIGETAREILNSNPHGCVLAICSNVIYLNSIHDDLFWLVTGTIPLHRRAIQISGAIPSVSVDSPFSIWEHNLLIGHDVDLDLSPASGWVPPQPNLEKILPLEDLPNRLRGITCMLDEFPKPAGFGIILFEIVKIAISTAHLATVPKPGLAVKHAQPAFYEIVKACIANNFPRILKTAEDLIGLGEGLTPSGDDFIGGLLFANFTLQENYAQYQGLTSPDVELFLDHSRNRTNLISYTMLTDLARGNAFDTLHRFINIILTDQHLEDVKSIGLELVRIGHSTGWDLLTGLWTGMLLCIGSRAALSSHLYDYTPHCRTLRKVSYGY
jgi:hypothetical protein